MGCWLAQHKSVRLPGFDCQCSLLILAPCGHKCICAGCRGQLQECPLCRTLIQATVRAVY